MISYWEQQSLLHYDVIIIGSGIVGMQSAIQLRKLKPKLSIAILERGILPSGASTRNAGFACFGSVAELNEDLKTMSEDETCALFGARMSGINALREQLGDARIGYKAEGSHELLTQQEEFLLDKVEYFNKLLREFSKGPLFEIQNERISEFGFSTASFKYCIEAKAEGSVHTGMLIRALQQCCHECGVDILTGCKVNEIEENKQGVRVYVQDKFRKCALTFSATKVLICTNAFSSQFFPDEDIQPGRGQVLITEPIPGLRLKGIFHYDCGYYYFREIDGRVLLGGGRNLAKEDETTVEYGIHPLIAERLEEDLRNKLLPYCKEIRIAQRWAGIMAFGADKRPIIRRYSERILGAFRLGGMGVALGTHVAQSLAQMSVE